jgi:hypothetical protein
MTTHVIERYEVSMWSSRPTTPGAPVVGIWLYGPAEALGYAYFFLDGTQLEPPVIDQGFIALQRFHRPALQPCPVRPHPADSPGREPGLPVRVRHLQRRVEDGRRADR